MRKQIFEEYRGRLTPADAAVGIAAAQENAARLLRDATLLLEAGSWPSAAALAILAIEEYGKLPLLQRIVPLEDVRELKEAWKNYRSHTAKNIRWFLPHLVDQGPKSIEELVAALHPVGAQFVDEMKQKALYTSCNPDKSWSVPDKTITRKFAEGMVDAAKRLIRVREMTAKEVEIHARYDALVGRAETQAEKKRLITQHIRELRQEGLVNISDEGIETLLNGKMDLQGVGK